MTRPDLSVPRPLAGLAIALTVGLAALAQGCASIEDGVGPLPDAMRTVAGDVEGRGYPDLARVPPVPTNLPGPAQFNRLEDRLVQERRALEASRGGQLPTAAEQSQVWADESRRQIERDPRSAPVADTSAEAQAWADGERARMEALLRRLPPVQGVPN
jgi:hypothetical protein